MTANDLKNLHPSDVVYWLHVEKAVWRLAEATRSRIRAVRPTKKGDILSSLCSSTLFGRCDYSHPNQPKRSAHELEITTRIFVADEKVWSQRRVELHVLLDSICHEMAHARAGWHADHGPKFFREFARTVVIAEKIKIRLDILAAGVKVPT